MWREHYKTVFKAEETPYNGDLCKKVDEMMSSQNSVPTMFRLVEINSAIQHINTNKSYDRHYHWKFLDGPGHAAKHCLLAIFNSWSSATLSNQDNQFSDLFISALNPIPKKGKKDLSNKGSYRPISIGSTENWILERIFLERLDPYLHVHDCQMGYKKSILHPMLLK